MPPRKKKSARPPTAAKPSTRQRTKIKALAVNDAVKREAPRRSMLDNQLSLFEPLRRSVLDNQMALLGAMMTWSPARLLVNQQAAFWEGFAAPSAAQGPSVRKRTAKSVAKRARGR
ncbi:MAG: hypothetical protein M5U16_00940 [Hyphomicrobium sp.]|nr:hypothetical protein [Hyphomicrobium sp.]